MAALLRDRRLRQGGVESLTAQGITAGPLAGWMRMVILNIEGEQHARRRHLVSKAFTPRAVDALRPVMRAEVMRVRPAVPVIWRVAAEDFEFKGLQITAGTFLSMFAAAAHTDPRVFDSAERDIGLERPVQLTFGGGIHYCLGAPLARAEMEEALPILAARLYTPELAGRVHWRPALGIYGPIVLPIRSRSAP